MDPFAVDEPRTDPRQFVGIPNKITPKQRNFILKLVDKKEHGLPEGDLDRLYKMLRISEDPEEFGMGKDVASRTIAWLLKKPDKPKTEAQTPYERMLPEVPDGRYAIPKEDGTLMFYSVKKGRHITFLDVWASDAQYPIKNPVEKRRIMQAIKNDPDSGPRFGREIGRCYVCGRTLTDELSRQIGIGPVCRGL